MKHLIIIMKIYIYEFLADDIITIKATHDVPIILLADSNSRIGVKSDFEY